MVEFERGALVWAAPMEKQVTRIPMFLCSLALFGFGGFFVYAIVDVIRPTRDTLATPGLWIAIVMVMFFVSFGAWVFYCAIKYIRPVGIQFFLHGVEIGEGSKRRLIRYVELETFTCAPKEINIGVDTALFALRTVAAIATLNPASVGRTIADLNEEPIYSHLTIKPRDSDILTFPLTRSDYDKLAPILPKT